MTINPQLRLEKSSLIQDIFASGVVFLVALPLCMGIAIASGVPAAYGLITGIVGGTIVSAISGSPLQVSGPAAGLAVIVAEVIADRGLEMLGPIILLAGLFQLFAGIFKMGQIFRAISPAVIYGMLTGIGLLILMAQFHVMLGDKPRSNGLENLITIPKAIYSAIVAEQGSVIKTSAILGVISITSLIIWDRFKPRQLKLLPGALIAVVLATAIASIQNLPVRYVDIPSNVAEVIKFPTIESLLNTIKGPSILEAIGIAFIASAESLLSASAVDRLHQGERTNFDRELTAQGIGNAICGFLGVLPMTGVIVRSSVNVEAGAKTRLSGLLHGWWIFALAVAAPTLLKIVPTCSLAAILVVTGYKLIEVKHIRKLLKYGRFPVIIFFATAIGIFAIDLLTGVVLGIVLTAISLIYKFSHLNISVVKNETNHRVDVYLEGTVTFIKLPELAAFLERVPPNTELHVHLEKLTYIDHSCFDFFSNWAKQQETRGSTLVLEWEGLEERSRKPMETTQKAKNTDKSASARKSSP
jgi:MFS superfamily sulfate permease-like transporter